MKALHLTAPSPADQRPLALGDTPVPIPGEREVLVRVHACGVCRTDLHIIEGDLVLPRLPLIPGHQIVGTVDAVGREVTLLAKGERVGIPWLFSTCGSCEQCRADRENLCDNGMFTGYHTDGGYAEYVVVGESFAYRLPEGFSDAAVAPLLCAGVIGYRALRLSGIRPGERLGMYGFGASAHITIQIARHWQCEVYVFTRGKQHKSLAEEFGAVWTGSADQLPPRPLHSAIVFSPSGEAVPAALKAIGKGGTVALAGIHMTPIPSMEYTTIYHEKTLRSVANSTRQDVREMLDAAAEIPVRTEVETFPLEAANDALITLKHSTLRGSAVLSIANW
ncbi:MAG: zinc-dependent alcohol dehydrogenase family protein [Bacteroidota bacterium]